MALLPLSKDYSDKDFDALRERMIQLARSVFPAWTDMQVANFGNVLIELMAYVGDVLSFYQDVQANEAFLVTANLRRSILNLVTLIGYRPKGASAATVDEVFTLAAALSGELVIPKGDRVLTAEVTSPIAYQLLQDLVFAPGETSKTAQIEHSAYALETFDSTGMAWQSVQLTRTPYLDGSAVVTATDGTYSEVIDLLSSSSTDRHFAVVVDQADRATITFGNGVTGSIPTGTISVSYKTGGGQAGRVEAGTLKRLERVYYDSAGVMARLSAINPQASSGGEDRDSNSQIVVNAPRSLRVLERCVAREDYEIAAEQVAGVARALHLTNNEYGGIGENEGLVFVVPTTGGAPSSSLLASVARVYETDSSQGGKPKSGTYHVEVLPAQYRTIDIQTTVYFRPGVTKAVVREAIVRALTQRFALYVADSSSKQVLNELAQFGYYQAGGVAWSDVFDLIRDIPGVLKLDPGAGLLLNQAREDLVLLPPEFPKLGSVQVIDGATGALV